MIEKWCQLDGTRSFHMNAAWRGCRQAAGQGCAAFLLQGQERDQQGEHALGLSREREDKLGERKAAHLLRDHERCEVGPDAGILAEEGRAFKEPRLLREHERELGVHLVLCLEEEPLAVLHGLGAPELGMLLGFIERDADLGDAGRVKTRFGMAG